MLSPAPYPHTTEHSELRDTDSPGDVRDYTWARPFLIPDMSSTTDSSLQLYEVGTVITVLQLRKLRREEVKEPA